MAGPASQRPSWTLAMERRFAILYNASACSTAMSVALIVWSRNLVHEGPFPHDMKKCFTKLYEYDAVRGSGAYEGLRNSLLVGIVVFVLSRLHFARLIHRLASAIDKLIRRHSPSSLRAIGYRGRQDWPIPAPSLGVTMVIPALCLTVFVFAAYFDTIACYSRYIRAELVVYEPCDILGTSTLEYLLCKSASTKLFAVQMTSLGFAAVPASVLVLHFGVAVYQIYAAFCWLNNQLRIIKAGRPQIDAELDSLEAQERLMSGSNRV